jgi:adenylate kinase family enzyme
VGTWRPILLETKEVYMIIKLHGTSGAGKSTIAYHFLKHYWSEPQMKDGKIVAYRVNVPSWKQPLYILGRYSTACGGCDTLKADEQIELLHHYAPLGHVLYEGLLASEYYGRLGEASAHYGDNHVFAFLDTPIDLCIERIKARRAAAGNDKPLNEDNTRGRIKKIDALKRKLVSLYGRKVITIDHTNPIPQIMEVYDVAESPATR